MNDAVPNQTPEVKDSQDQAKETPPEETKKETTNTENDDQKDRRSKTAKPRREGDDQTAENEIRVAAKGQIKNYLGYAFRILNKTGYKSLTIRATGNAIVKALILIELVKRRVGDLHQKNRIYSLEIKSEEDSKIPEGMVQDGGKPNNIRRVTAMDTELSKIPLDTSDPGYQEPMAKEEKPEPLKEKEEGEKTKKSGKSRKPKLYNTPNDGEEEKTAENKQRRGKDKNQGKHEDEGDNNQQKKDNEGKKKAKKEKDAQKGDDQGGENDKGKDDQKQRQNKKNRKQFKYNLRNIIDEEDANKRRTRGGGDRTRGHRGGDRGDVRNRQAYGGYNQMYNDHGPSMHGNQLDQRGPATRGDGRRYNRRGNDDFGLQNPGDRERRGPGGQYNHQGYQRYNNYNNFDQNNEQFDRYNRHPRPQQYMYDGGQGPPPRYREQQQYRDDRNQWGRDGPPQDGNHGMRGGRGPMIREDRPQNERPREEPYERERINNGPRDQEFAEGPRQALSGNRGRGRGERGVRGDRGGRRPYKDHEEIEFNDHRGNRGGYRSDAPRGGFRGGDRGDRGGERGMRFRGDHGGFRARGGGHGGFDDGAQHFRGGRGRYEDDGGHRGGNRQDRRGGYEDDSGGHKIHTKNQRGGKANQDAPQNTSD